MIPDNIDWDISLRCFVGWHRGCHGVTRYLFSKRWQRYCPCKCHKKPSDPPSTF